MGSINKKTMEEISHKLSFAIYLCAVAGYSDECMSSPALWRHGAI